MLLRIQDAFAPVADSLVTLVVQSVVFLLLLRMSSTISGSLRLEESDVTRWHVAAV